jgi:hypothetical protein
MVGARDSRRFRDGGTGLGLDADHGRFRVVLVDREQRQHRVRKPEPIKLSMVGLSSERKTYVSEATDGIAAA